MSDYEEQLANKTDSSELNAESDSIDLERELLKTQDEIAKIAEINGSDVGDLQLKRNALIKMISDRARRMIKEEGNKPGDFGDSIRQGVSAWFDKINSNDSDGVDKELVIKTGITKIIDDLKERAVAMNLNSLSESNERLLNDEVLSEIQNKLDGCLVDSKEEFINGVTEALQPLIDAVNNRPDLAENAERKVFHSELAEKALKTNGEIKIVGETNNILSYGIGGLMGDSLHIHLAPMRTVENKLLFQKKVLPEAFKKLAQIIASKEEVKKVTATSPLVAAMPDFFEKMGFNIEAINEGFRNLIFEGKKQPILTATISREKFLELYPINN